jgi:hypothetical protein
MVAPEIAAAIVCLFEANAIGTETIVEIAQSFHGTAFHD